MGTTRVVLTWKAPENENTGGSRDHWLPDRILRHRQQLIRGWNLVENTRTSATTYTDNGSDRGTRSEEKTRYYRVSAINSAGRSATASECGQRPHRPIGGFASAHGPNGSSSGSRRVSIYSWNCSQPRFCTVTGYMVERSGNAKQPVGKTVLTVDGLANTSHSPADPDPTLVLAMGPWSRAPHTHYRVSTTSGSPDIAAFKRSKPSMVSIG